MKTHRMIAAIALLVGSRPGIGRTGRQPRHLCRKGALQERSRGDPEMHRVPREGDEGLHDDRPLDLVERAGREREKDLAGKEERPEQLLHRAPLELAAMHQLP